MEIPQLSHQVGIQQIFTLMLLFKAALYKITIQSRSEGVHISTIINNALKNGWVELTTCSTQEQIPIKLETIVLLKKATICVAISLGT